MNIKPSASNPVIVYRVRRFYGNLLAVKWSDCANYPRSYETLFRKVGGDWVSGELNPTGCHSSPLRIAHPIIAESLNAFTR